MFKLIPLLLLLGLSLNNAMAHQQKAAITKILFNAKTQHIEVMHRFYLHDAEHAVEHIFDRNADIINSNKTQREFSEYVAERFSLKSAGKVLPLSKVGFEIDGKFFWVYQETPEPVALTELSVQHNALRDIWPDQENLVNIEGKDQIMTIH